MPNKDTVRQPLSLKKYPDPILRQVCEPVERFDSVLEDLANEMLVFMRTCNGIGLAAPQVGIARRLFVCELGDHAICIVNPRIKDAEGHSEDSEGCLSVPELFVSVTRSKSLFLHGYDLKGRLMAFKMEGLWARVVQHELDHLNGSLICDYEENRQYMGKQHANT